LADFYAVESRGLALQKSGMPSTLPWEPLFPQSLPPFGLHLTLIVSYIRFCMWKSSLYLWKEILAINHRSLNDRLYKN
jgi:hypothetical protein